VENSRVYHGASRKSIRNGNALIGKVNLALHHSLSLSCFVPHPSFTDQAMLEQPICSLGYTPPIFTMFQRMVLSRDFGEAKITFPPPITFQLTIRV